MIIPHIKSKSNVPIQCNSCKGKFIYIGLDKHRKVKVWKCKNCQHEICLVVSENIIRIKKAAQQVDAPEPASPAR
jgi:hypothetical protein